MLEEHEYAMNVCNYVFLYNYNYCIFFFFLEKIFHFLFELKVHYLVIDCESIVNLFCSL